MINMTSFAEYGRPWYLFLSISLMNIKHSTASAGNKRAHQSSSNIVNESAPTNAQHRQYIHNSDKGIHLFAHPAGYLIIATRGWWNGWRGWEVQLHNKKRNDKMTDRQRLLFIKASNSLWEIHLVGISRNWKV